MRVWPKTTDGPLLSGSKGALVSVSINVDPRHLESLLEALSQVSFPINPQIYHDALLVYRYADEREETEATTLVEFPSLCRSGRRSPACTGSLRVPPGDDAGDHHAGRNPPAPQPEPAPRGAPYVSRCRVKHRLTAAAREAIYRRSFSRRPAASKPAAS